MLNTNKYVPVSMGTQISLKLSDKMLRKARQHSKKYGYDSLQDFIRETMRERLFGSPALASEEALARFWNTKEEEEAWAHLQKEK